MLVSWKGLQSSYENGEVKRSCLRLELFILLFLTLSKDLATTLITAFQICVVESHGGNNKCRI